MMLTGLAITLITGSLLGFGAYALLRASARARMTPYSLSSFTFYRPSSKEKSKTNEASHLQDSILQEPSLYISLVAPAYNEEVFPSHRNDHMTLNGSVSNRSSVRSLAFLHSTHSRASAQCCKLHCDTWKTGVKMMQISHTRSLLSTMAVVMEHAGSLRRCVMSLRAFVWLGKYRIPLPPANILYIYDQHVSFRGH